jgi:hypothetical protein
MWPFSYKCNDIPNEEIKHICFHNHSNTYPNPYYNYSSLSTNDEYPICDETQSNEVEDETTFTHGRTNRIKNCIQSITDCKNTTTVVKNLFISILLVFTGYKLIFYFHPPTNL